ERTVTRDLLAATELNGQWLQVGFLQEKQRQVARTARWRSPHELPVGRLSQQADLRRVARQGVKARRKAIDAVHEEGQVNGRRPRHAVPWHRSLADVAIDL